MDSNETRVAHHETPTFGNPDLPQEGMQTTAGDPADARMAGPRNPVLESQFPSVITAPATDISTQPFFWSSFNISPRRQQAGGWAREVTQADFAISDEISGVNMYLEPGGIRELHWHQTGEWAIMTEGKCRVTTLSREGKPSVEDVFKEDLWIFPGDEPGDLEADQVAAGVEWGGTELHWHPNADEWQYYMQGSARMTVFNTGPHANTTDFKAGDVGLVRRNGGHYAENTGDDDLVFIETFRSDHYEEVSLANWLSHLPPKLVSAHLNIPEETLAQFPRGAQGIVPLP
jgi:oxalate decarboxylase/phosphoglucose isomerase-like protein (cupin superfamily)